MVSATVLLSALMLLACTSLWAANRRFAPQPNRLIDAVDSTLPQTQCAQCGYPGCRPYARAIVEQGEAIDRCPPGGPATVEALRTLLGPEQRRAAVLDEPPALVARIDEARCIGCALCLPACPVDAIIGANGYLHTVLEAECTGCELCVAPCPVDCIDLPLRTDPSLIAAGA
ncbi:MAG: RnfABCDGE type electron transport complex subunit B [Pseudomonadota bacterium]